MEQARAIRPRLSVLAVVSLVLSLASAAVECTAWPGWLWDYVAVGVRIALLPMAALVLAVISIVQIRRSGGRVRGAWAAGGALALALSELLLLGFLILWLCLASGVD